MLKNRDVRIEIQGYVNGPDESNSDYFLNLSAQRAIAVKNYLILNGIDEKRISTKGFGNKNMLYPHPANEQQSEANRRVEIKIKRVK